MTLVRKQSRKKKIARGPSGVLGTVEYRTSGQPAKSKLIFMREAAVVAPGSCMLSAG